jgi:regulator of replication initiation timing
METDSTELEDDGAPASLSYVFKEEEQIAQVWNTQDRADYQQSVREIADQIVGLRQNLERLRTQTDTIWERFITLTLERILSEQLREFLDEIDVELQALDLRLVTADCEIDRLRARIQERRRLLEEKLAVLEPLAHRTSTQNHISMMLSRVEGLEGYLLGKKDVAPEAYEMHYKRHTTAPGDLLYLRVRLLTTRIAILASNRSRHLSELDAGLNALLPEVERIKTGMATILTRADCIRDLSRYWLAYLNISQPMRSEE